MYVGASKFLYSNITFLNFFEKGKNNEGNTTKDTKPARERGGGEVSFFVLLIYTDKGDISYHNLIFRYEWVRPKVLNP